jgi:hypothetical protein
MLIEKLSKEDIELCGFLNDPVFISECLFVSDLNKLDSLQFYKDDEYFSVRLYQLPFLSYDYLLAEDNTLSKAQNFQLRKGSGNRYIFSGRGIGKTLFLLIDLCLDTIHNCQDWVTIVASFDDDHVANLIEPYITAIKKHPLLKQFFSRATREPYNINTLPNRSVVGVNMTLSGREQGSQFEGHHARKIIGDEYQYLNDVVQQKSSQSISENGAIEKFSGITSFRRLSPMGKIFFDLNKRNWLVNLPKSVSPAWCENEKKKALEDFSDEGSTGWKIHIEAEVVENALGLYDIDLIRKTYLHNLHRPIKHFEVNKESFSFFKDKIIVERPTNAKRTWIAYDFGAQAAPTEIIVIFEIETNDNKKLFKYIYNITLNNLIPDQQTEIFKYLIKELKADYVGGDCTELGSSQVIQDLNPLLPQERLIKVRFNEKILVGYEKDDNDILKIVDGKTVPIEAYVIDWAVEKTRELFYKQKIDCLYDMKLDKEFNAMVAVRQATRLKYSTLLANKQDHLHAAWLVFGIMRFLKEESLDNKIPTLTWGIGVVKTI